ncbi:amino acid transporter [Microbacterium sp. HD4P20]|uniref:amino acid transporter n=1 Tax=Microbacterium sp. HD4P20 TaxID=2864874 RepID=UPI001C63B959|nr:amino acid transporter [Microbacterium sp. HD4P20]MCP2638260.1 amino acid transporter [Microbacterium sp. HD4P20]
MSDDRPTRRDLMKPVQLLGLAFGAAAFAGIVTLVSMGFFQQRTGEEAQAAVTLALIIAGVTFIAVLVIVALLLLAVDPAQVSKQVDRPVLLPDADDENHDDDENPDAVTGDAPKA